MPATLSVFSVESPCIKVCTLDAQGICLGCGRNLDEIAGWSGMAADERRAVCSRAAERRRNQGVG